jgi:AraC-like DNA-binding protein
VGKCCVPIALIIFPELGSQRPEGFSRSAVVLCNQITSTAVAERLGYADRSHLAREVRRFLGMSPQQFAFTQANSIPSATNTPAVPLPHAPA